ncbi:unnamed protein product [Dovyalis caffra]|uniref:Uncharacterized protein n=1 Tax=Dovyalis caffra TaxID=77055 RepID=A0AAV1SMC8_9ROSI|nr:unnamed protein product [Dovyalis caffra]
MNKMSKKGLGSRFEWVRNKKGKMPPPHRIFMDAVELMVIGGPHPNTKSQSLDVDVLLMGPA